MPSATLSDGMRRFLAETRYAVLATINRDGTPQQTVMWYELRDDHILMNTSAGRVKDHNVRRDPRVSVCWEDEYRYLTIRGTATLVEDDPTTQADIYHLAHRYNPNATDADYPVFRTQHRISWKISIDRVEASGFDD